MKRSGKKTIGTVESRSSVMEESLTFLSRIFDLLVKGEAFETQSNELKSVIDFKHPQELKVRQLLSELQISMNSRHNDEIRNT